MVTETEQPILISQMAGSSSDHGVLQDTGVDCPSVLQGVFPTQGSNLGLLHYRQMLYHLSHREALVLLSQVESESEVAQSV